MVYSKTVLQNNISLINRILLGKWFNYLINRDIIYSLPEKYKNNNKKFDKSEMNVLNSIFKQYNKNQKI